MSEKNGENGEPTKEHNTLEIPKFNDGADIAYLDTIEEGVILPEKKEKKGSICLPVIAILDPEDPNNKELIPVYEVETSLEPDGQYRVFLSGEVVNERFVISSYGDDPDGRARLEMSIGNAGQVLKVRAVNGNFLTINRTQFSKSGDWYDLAEDDVITMFSGGNVNVLKEISLYGRAQLEKTWMKHFLKRELEFLFEKRNMLMKDYAWDPSAVDRLDQALGNIRNINGRYELGVISELEFEQRIEKSNRIKSEIVNQRRYEIKQRLVGELLKEIMEEELVLAEKMKKDRLELARRNVRENAVQGRCEQEGLKKLHLKEDEDPLTCEIVYKGPVFRIVDPTLHADRAQQAENEPISADFVGGDIEDDSMKKKKYSYNPLLLYRYVLGKHPACFNELSDSFGKVGIDEQQRKTLDKIYRSHELSDFMAELRFDAVKGELEIMGIDPDIRIKRDNAVGFEPFMRPVYPLSQAAVVKLGPYQLIVDQDHGYTAKVLFEEASSHAREMLEIIFDVESTTEAQDLEAYMNLNKIFSCNLPNEDREKLVKLYSKRYFNRFQSLWKKVKSWTAENGELDAQCFVPLKMSISVASKGQTFLPELGVDMDDLWQQVQLRIDKYMRITVEDDSKGKSWLEAFRIGQPKPERKVNFAEKLPSYIEVARFVEMGLIKVAELSNYGNKEALDAVKKILHIRKLIGALATVDSGQMLIIEKLQNEARGMKMSDVYAEDEIGIRDQNINLNLDADVPIVGEARQGSYMVQLVRIVAKNAWLSFRDDRTAVTKKRKMKLVKTLLDTGMVKPIYLVDMQAGEDPISKASEIKMMIDSMEDDVRTLEEREGKIKEEAALARQAEDNLFNQEYKNKADILKQGLDCIKFLLYEDIPSGWGGLMELMEWGNFIGDRDVEKIFNTYWVKAQNLQGDSMTMVEPPEQYVSFGVKLNGDQRSWEDLKNIWKSKVISRIKGLLLEMPLKDNVVDYLVLAEKLLKTGAIDKKELPFDYDVVRGAVLKYRERLINKSLGYRENMLTDCAAKYLSQDEFVEFIVPIDMSLLADLKQYVEQQQELDGTDDLENNPKLSMLKQVFGI